MGADVLPEQYEPPKGFYVLLGVDEPDEAERICNALTEDDVVALPMTSWSATYPQIGSSSDDSPASIGCAEPEQGLPTD